MLKTDNMKDVMLDIETMGTRVTSMIIQIGACYFDRETGEIGEKFFTNIKHHNDTFTTDYDTILWWMDQSKEAQESLQKSPLEIEPGIMSLAIFLGGAEYTWSHATFDIPILTNTFDKLGMEFPVSHRGMRDIRTLMDLSDHEISYEREGVHHNALDDCEFQVKYCVEALNDLKNNVDRS